MIFEGTPDEMHRSDLVRAAYLGDSAVVTAAAPDDALPDDALPDEQPLIGGE